MNNTRRVMLLIDADNVSADVIEQAVQRTMAEHGAIHVRRAYCNAEAAVKHQALFKRLSVRPMVNLSAGKNSTDIALAVDALDLVIAERPEVVVLVSSDSDFAPLVIRLREKGCRVCGLGQQGKTGEETTAVYDEFTDLQHQAARAPAAKRPARAPRRAKAAAAGAQPAGAAGGRAAHPGCRSRDAQRRADGTEPGSRGAALGQVAGPQRQFAQAVQEAPRAVCAHTRNAAQQSPVPGATGEVSVDRWQEKLRVLDTGGPWFAPWRDVGKRVAASLAGGAPLHEALNAHATAALRFASSQELPPAMAYEQYIFETARCPTRENLHDFFNGLCWLQLPLAKKRLNELQAGEIARAGVGGVRGPVRDAITVFDENGALLDAPPAIWEALLARDWPRLFIDLRPLWAQARIVVFGHALLEKLAEPRKDITAHVWVNSPQAPSAPPPRGRHQRPGKAGSAVARAWTSAFVPWPPWTAGWPGSSRPDCLRRSRSRRCL